MLLFNTVISNMLCPLMTHNVPARTSRMILAFLPTQTSPWSGHTWTPVAGPAWQSRRAGLLLTVCVVTRCVLWRGGMVSPQTNHNSKILAFLHACCLAMLGSVVVLYASPITSIQFMSVPSPTNLNPTSFTGAWVP